VPPSHAMMRQEGAILNTGSAVDLAAAGVLDGADSATNSPTVRRCRLAEG